MATAEIIEGYCDESGIQDGASNCVVAGWVATSRKWKLFESRWSRASGGVEFHGKQFFARDPGGNRVGPYRGWPDDRANKYLQGLLDAILDCQLRSIGAVINVADFQARTVEERKWLTGAAYLPDFKKWEGRGSPQRPYYLGFTECVEQGAACVKNPDWKIHFYFDQQNVLAPYAADYYQRARGYAPPPLARRLGELTFKSRDGLGALQAADLLAHACYKRGSVGIGERQELDAATVRLRPITFGRIVHYHTPIIEERLAALAPQWRREWKA